MSYVTNTTSRPIYGIISKSKSCVYNVPSDLDINTYLTDLNKTLYSLKQFNNKQGAIENILIIETRLNTAITSNTRINI